MKKIHTLSKILGISKKEESKALFSNYPLNKEVALGVEAPIYFTHFFLFLF